MHSLIARNEQGVEKYDQEAHMIEWPHNCLTIIVTLFI